MWCSSLLNSHLYKWDDGRIVIRTSERSEDLAHRMNRRESCTIELQLGSASYLWNAAMFVMHQRGSQFWWSLPDMVVVIGLAEQRSAKHLNKLYQEPWHAWTRFLSTLDLDLHLRRAAPYTYATGAAAASDDECESLARILEYCSASTHAVLALLVRMAWKPRATGGLSSQVCKDKCVEVLGALFERVPRPCELCVFVLNAVWEPPLLPQGDSPVRLYLTDDLNVSINQLKDISRVLADAGRMPVCPGVQAAENVVMLCDFLKLCMEEKAMFVIFKQLIWALGTKLEEGLKAELENEEPPLKKVRVVEFGSENRQAVAKRLAKYYAATVEAFSNKRVMSLSVDAAEVGGKRRLYGVLALPDNTVAWMCPQAALGCGRSLNTPGRVAFQIF